MRSLFKNHFNSPMRSPTAEEAYAFKMHLTPGDLPYDEVTNTKASCSISGARYGIVNGVVSSFASNVPPVEDKGLRGCPAFTQLAKYSEDLTNAAWVKSNILTPVLAGTFQGQNIWNCVEATTASSYHILSQSVVFSTVADNSVIGISVVAKYSGRKLLFSVQAKDGTYKTSKMNLQTGVEEFNSGVAASITPLDSGYYRVFFAANVLTGATSPNCSIQFNNGVSSQYTGDGVSGVLLGQPTYINFGVNGIPFIPPYVPNNTGSSVSVVSEVGGASNGTSFAINTNPKLVQLKKILQGGAVGNNLWGTPGLVTPPWTQTTDYYVCDGTNNGATTSCAGILTAGKLYEVEFTTGSVTSGTLTLWVGGQQVFNGTPTSNTKYTVRTAIPVTSTNVSFTNTNAFIGQISKNVIVREVQAQGHIELTFKSNVDSGWLGLSTHTNILSSNNSNLSVLYLTKDGAGTIFCRCYDRTNLVAMAIPPITVGAILQISIDFGTYTDGTLKMRLTVDGVKSSIVAFTGSFGSQDLRFFYDNLIHAGWIKNLSYSEKPLW